MKSIFFKILLWFLGTVAIALAGFLVTSWVLSARLPGHDHFFLATQAFQLDGARQAYEEGGASRLRRYLNRLNTYYRAQHYLVNAAGKDLASGHDRSTLLARAGSFPRPPASLPDGRFVVSRRSYDGRYTLLIMLPPPFGPWVFLPYFLWILLVVVVLCYVLAVYLGRPLIGLREAVERFGSGELAVRLDSTRRDEIGDLARAFDRMAERITTLLTAERRLLQDVSHELRSPLARLVYALELARTASDREASLGRAARSRTAWPRSSTSSFSSPAPRATLRPGSWSPLISPSWFRTSWPIAHSKPRPAPVNSCSTTRVITIGSLSSSCRAIPNRSDARSRTSCGTPFATLPRDQVSR